jgi:2,3-bisphosphoglycerate-independent phosphoglycerate mutase
MLVKTSSYHALILIGDGLGDRPIAQFGGQTPLEAQPTPNLDEIAALGECGLMDPIGPGIPAGSDTAHFSMLGYDPFKYYTGRGPLEALGVGLEVRRGDLGFRCNFASVEEASDGTLLVVDRRAQRIAKGTAELAAAVNEIGPVDGIEFILKESVEHRAALVMRGEGLDPHLTDADPHDDPEGKPRPVEEVRATDPAAEAGAKALNEWVKRTHQVLRDHPVNQARVAEGKLPANIILPRGCGVAPHLEPFEREHGVRGGLVVEVGLIKGLGRYLEMAVLDAPGATGGYDTDHISLAKTALKALEEAQIVLCNLKAPDLAGHDGEPEKKRETVAKLDELAGVVLEAVDLDSAVIVLTGDHSTPVSVHDHSGDPLPIAFAGHGVRADHVREFGERPCAQGNLGRIRGHDIMAIITNLLGIAEKFGA